MGRHVCCITHLLLRIGLGPALLSFLVFSIGCSSYVAVLKKSGPQPQSGMGGQILFVTSSNLASTYGAPVTFTAIAPNNATGLVNFLDSGNTIGSATLNQNVATLTTSALRAGSHEITAVWAGDSISGPMESPSIVQTVGRAVPILAWPTPAPITYGTTLGEGQLDAKSGGIAGTLIYTPKAGTILPAGHQTLTATFSPTDTADYISATQTVQLNVDKASPAIAWSSPEPLDYGIPLSSEQLDASASIAGNFTYSPSAGTILNPGQNPITAVFTPADPADYNSVVASTTQVVIQPSITVSAPASSILEGSSMLFSASVAGAIDKSIQWEVDGTPGGNSQVGTISPDGAYTAPVESESTLTATVAAVLQAYPASRGSAEVQIVNPQSSPGTIGFAFTLPTAASTSAGVYDSSGVLVRTLWSSETFPAGAHAATWDGRDDAGNTVPTAPYQIRVLYNNVTYTWGLIGDTSSDWLAKNSWDRQALRPVAMVASGDGVYVANGYAEGRPNASWFPLTSPQQPQALFTAGQCNWLQFVATDGKLVYFASEEDGWKGSAAYVMAYDPSAHQYYTFPMGVTRVPVPDPCGRSEPSSVIDYISPSDVIVTGGSWAGISGLAVQSDGTLLAVAQGASDKTPSQDIIKLFNKTSGAQVGVIHITDPQGLAFAPNGDLWAISGTSVVLISDVGNSNAIIRQLPNLSAPLAIAVDPSTSDVLVSDGGRAQQVKRFSAAGMLISTYGDLGGYTDCNPEVTNSRLFLDRTGDAGFSPTAGFDGGGGNFLAVLRDGSYWVGDPGNARALHISPEGQYIDQISFLPFLYHVTVDHGDPSRVFAQTWEYHVDYSKSLSPGDPDPSLGGNGSWSLVRNWAACLPSPYNFQWFTQVQTFENGRTYASIPNPTVRSIVSGGAEDELAELPASGPVRFSGKFLEANPGFDEFFSHGGNLAYWLFTYSPDNRLVQLGYSQSLTGYDSQGWPTWGSPSLLATLPSTEIYDPPQTTDPIGFRGWGMIFWPEPTKNNLLVTYNTNPAPNEPSYHLGGIPIGGTTWSWKASPGAMINTPDGKGSFPDINNHYHNGIAALVEGGNIIEGYDGQYASFSSQWMLWSQDGLLIGQFGHPATGPAPDGSLFPGAAGNIETMSTATVDGDIYLYNSDESYHPGIHRWKIGNLDTVRELVGTSQLGSTAILK